MNPIFFRVIKINHIKDDRFEIVKSLKVLEYIPNLFFLWYFVLMKRISCPDKPVGDKSSRAMLGWPTGDLVRLEKGHLVTRSSMTNLVLIRTNAISKKKTFEWTFHSKKCILKHTASYIDKGFKRNNVPIGQRVLNYTFIENPYFTL